MKTRDIRKTITIAGTKQEVVNQEIFCPDCDEWINSIFWMLDVSRGQISHTCGECGYIHIK